MGKPKAVMTSRRDFNKILALSSAKPVQKKEIKKRAPRSKIGLEEAKAAAKMTSEQWKKKQAGMDEKWPAPEYMAKDWTKGHTNYRAETYAEVTRWMKETRIAYRPHAKSPGSKSHVRYERYSKAKTVGEALKLGSWPVDWCWDFERGFIKVFGPVRDEPVDISQMLDTERDKVTDVDMTLHKWYIRELCRMLQLNQQELQNGKGSNESTVMRAHRLVANRTAKKFLEAADRQKRRVTDEEVAKTLKDWKFAKNITRQNVIPDDQNWVFSDTLGILRDRLGDIHVSSPTSMYPEVTRILVRWLMDRLPKEAAGFSFTSINVNCNYAAKTHRDGNNFGPSFISAFGDFEGGELGYYPEDDGGLKLGQLPKKEMISFSLRSKGKSNLALFNGNSAHQVSKFHGTRFSLVYFTSGCHADIDEEDGKVLQDLGIPLPAKDEDPRRFLRAAAGYGGGRRAAKTRAGSTCGFWSAADLEKQKYTPRRIKITGAAEQLRQVMELGKGIRGLRMVEAANGKTVEKGGRGKEAAASVKSLKKRPASTL